MIAIPQSLAGIFPHQNHRQLPSGQGLPLWALHVGRAAEQESPNFLYTTAYPMVHPSTFTNMPTLD